MSDKPKLIAICGPSATGKSFLAKELEIACFQRGVGKHKIISHTTRPMRQNECDGFDYFFVSQDEFYQLAAQGKMLEYTSFRGWHYGTAISQIREGVVNIGVFNAHGITKLIEQYQDEYDIFVVKLEATLGTRFNRSILREQTFKPEFIRRAIADYFDSKKIDRALSGYFNYMKLNTDSNLEIAYILNTDNSLTYFINSACRIQEA